MAHLSCRTDPVPSVTLDPGHLTITLHIHPVHVDMNIPEAARLAAEIVARVAQARNVKGAPAGLDLTESSEWSDGR